MSDAEPTDRLLRDSSAEHHEVQRRVLDVLMDEYLAQFTLGELDAAVVDSVAAADGLMHLRLVGAVHERDGFAWPSRCAAVVHGAAGRMMRSRGDGGASGGACRGRVVALTSFSRIVRGWWS